MKKVLYTLLCCRALKEALDKEAKDRQMEANQLRNIISDNAKVGGGEGGRPAQEHLQ